ncbi:MAG: hypothetical protein H0U74_15120 [Bradymonadaceae bacterium]|nr:hypothetical protein [Lujinxingiaceae bacterium]
MRTSPEGETLTTTPRTYSTTSTLHSSEISETHKRLSWSAVFAGTVVALVVMLLLNMLGIAIGASAFDPVGGQDMTGFGIGAGIWWTVAALISLFAGGWVAGRVAGIPERYEAVIHGIVTWGLVSLVTIFMLATTAGNLVGGALGVVGQTLSAVTDSPALSEAIEGQVAEQQAQPGPIIDTQQAQQIGAQASDVVAGAAFWAFIALLLGGLLAAIGGAVGGRSFETEDRYRGEEKSRTDYRPGRVRHA